MGRAENFTALEVGTFQAECKEGPSLLAKAM